MSPSNDQKDEMSRGKPTDSNIERLISRDGSEASDADLRRLIVSLTNPEKPPHDVDTMATALAATARAAQTKRTHRGFRRFATLASAGALMMALASLALASDNSVPGDALYGVDRALEAIGVGNGGVDERIVEFDALIAKSQDQRAYSMLAEFIDTEEGAASARAQHHLELAATKANPGAESAQQKVAALQDFIEKNKGHGVGADGKEFGQRLADIAKTTGDEPGSNQVSGGASDSSQSGSDTGEQPGNSANAPGQQQDGASQSNPSEGEQPEEQRGNSANAPGRQTDKKDGS